jgi:hypothetical protein
MGVENRISSLEMFAWSKLNGVRLSPFEVSVLDELEIAFLRRKRD